MTFKSPLLLLMAVALSCCSSTHPDLIDPPFINGDDNEAEASTPDPMDDNHVVVAYSPSWTDIIPDPQYVTHINYAFGHVKESFDGVRIDNLDNFKKIASLKDKNPRLKVLLSIGGWGSGRFSEMAADPNLRKSFANDCKRVVDEYKIDGIDIDWEFPGSNSAGISSSPQDPANFILLLKDIRESIGDNRLLTIATSASAEGMMLDKILPYVNFINIMTYDMANAPKHHSALYRSENVGWMSVDESVRLHIDAGVPPSKLVMGVPFYGRGCDMYGGYVPYSEIVVMQGCTARWDDKAKAPFISDSKGKFVLGYETPRSITYKREYIKEKGLKGIMYWEYSLDNYRSDLRRAAAGIDKVK